MILPISKVNNIEYSQLKVAGGCFGGHCVLRPLLLVQPRGWTLCLYWVTCLRIRAFAMAVYMHRRSIIIRAFDGNARLLAKITAVCIDIYIFLWGNLSRAIIYFSNSIKERFTNSTREFCNSLFANVRFGLTIWTNSSMYRQTIKCENFREKKIMNESSVNLFW